MSEVPRRFTVAFEDTECHSHRDGLRGDIRDSSFIVGAGSAIMTAEATLRELTQNGPFLSARRVELSQGLTLDEVEQLFEQARSSHGGTTSEADGALTCAVNYVAWRHARKAEEVTSLCSGSVTLCGSRQEADRLCREKDGFACAVYALRVRQAAGGTSVLDEVSAGNPAGAPPPSLTPAVTITLRPHPLVTRASLEAADPGSCKEVCAPPATLPLRTTAELQGSGAPGLSPPAPPPPSPGASTPRADAVQETKQPTEESSTRTDATVCVATAASVRDTAAQAVGAGEARDGVTVAGTVKHPTSVFDLMCGAANQATPVTVTTRRTKRTRKESTAAVDATGETKPTHSRKPKLEAAATTTKSLTKLARASAKAMMRRTGVGVQHKPGRTGSVLDDEENDTDTVNSTTNSMSIDQASNLDAHGDEADMTTSSAIATLPAFDVQVTTVNDEIIMCDDAPPLVFCAPTATSPAPVTPTVQEIRAAPNRDGDTASQPTLSAFFSPAVTAFQRGFEREVDTETALVDGEYICRDVVRYRVVASGELVDEAEFHKRTADFIRQHKEQQAAVEAQQQRGVAAKEPTPALSTVETNKESITRGGGKGAGRLRVARQVSSAAKTESASGMTLLSFMKRT